MMTEQTTTAVTAPATAITFTLAGITLWPFLVTFFFAFFVMINQTKMEVRSVFTNVILSTALGGALSQLIAPPALLLLQHRMPELAPWTQVAELSMVGFLAIVFGVTAHVAVPTLLNWISRIGGAQ